MREPKSTPSKSLLALLNFFDALHPLSAKAKEIITLRAYPMEFKKNAFLFKPGSRTHTIYYLMLGVVRGYRKYKGIEITTWLNEENEIITSISNLGLDQECEEYIQAITDVQVMALPSDAVMQLYSECAETVHISRLLLEDNYRGAEERAFLSRLPVAADKFQRFIKLHPQLINRVPLKYTASYLGMRLETLCRLRSKQFSTPLATGSIL